MNFHEYQAKDLFAEYGIPVPAGLVAATPLAAVEAARELGATCGSSRRRFMQGAGARPVESNWCAASKRSARRQNAC